MGSLTSFLSSDGFMPHGHCFLWTPLLLWTYVLSDALIGLAYYSIPVALWYFVRRRSDLPFTWVFIMFAVFIFACGTTHLMAIWNIWQPVYWLDAGIKMATAGVSVATAALLWPLLPKALSLPSPGRLDRANRELTNEIAERGRVERRLHEMNQQLEQRVAERTTDLEAANQELRCQIDERQEVERSLRDNQQLLQSILNNSTTVVYVKDLAGRYLLINRRYEELFHLTQANILGKTDYDLFSKEDADAFRAVDERVAASGEVVEAEEVAPLDDSPHTYISIKFPVRDAAGRTYAVGGVSTDITERKRAERTLRDSEERTRLIVHTALDAVITMDNEGSITGWNPQAEATFGWTRQEAVGRALQETIIPLRYRDAHERGLRRYLVTGEASVLDRRIELTAVHRDGHDFPVELAIAAIRLGEGVSFSAFVRDITQRKQAEETLRKSQEQLLSLVEQAPVSIAMFDRDLRHIVTSRRWQAEYGGGYDSLIGRHYYEVHPDLPEPWKEVHRRGLAGEFLSSDEDLWVLADGSKHWLRWAMHPWRNAGGEIGGIIISAEDITDRKQSEVALHASQRLLQAVADNSAAIIWVKDLEGRYLLINGGYEKLFDVRREDIIGKTDHDLFPKAQADIFRAVDREALASGTAVQAEEAAFYGDQPVTLLSVKCALVDDIGKPYALCGISTDITQRKRAEQALAAERTLLRTLIDALPDFVFIKDTAGRFTMCNTAEVRRLKLTREEEAVGKSVFDFYSPEMAELYQTDDRQCLAGQPVLDREEPGIDAAGNQRWYLTIKVPLHDDAGKVTGMVGVSRDITERRQAQQKLQAQLHRLDLLNTISRAIGERQDLRSIFQVVIRSLEQDLSVDFSCVCLYDQPAHALIVTSVGVHSEALATELAMAEQARVDIDENGLSRCVRGQLVYEPDISQVAFPFPKRLARGGLGSLVVAPLLVESQVFGVVVAARRQPHSFSSGECEFLRQLSEHVALAAHQAQLHEALQQAYDDLRQTQQAVMQQERLGALGQMASGIAHDINNAISPVALYTESLLEKEPNLSARARAYLETIQRAIEDVAQTVARMREFYRQREPQLTLAPVQLNRLVQQVMDLTRARWSDMPQQRGIVIQMVTDLAADLPAIMGVESEIREALINLVFNAVDAMPEGGALTLRTRVEDHAPGSEEGSAWQQVYVEVVDTGVGMDEDTRRRCLEPFFTTKGERGTGLGLAMVYGMVQRHSAKIEVESTVSRGTIMRLSFAVSAAMTESPQPARAYAVPSRLRILIVDDDPLLLKSLRDTLELDGHVVVTANGGQAGIDAFRAGQARSESFAVVITDLGMPYVDGRKVVSAVKEASPSTPVILLTGWGERLVANGDVPANVDRVLSKPPKLRELREAFAHCCSPRGS